MFCADSRASVAIDLLGCDYLDSTFLGCLLNLQRVGAGTQFQVVADEAARKRVLAATQLDGYLTLVPEAPNSTSPFMKLDANPVSERELGQQIMESHQALAEVPSEFASEFRRIASRLMCELERQDRQSEGQADTVILSTRRQQ